MAQTSAFSRFFSLFNPVSAIRDFKEVWVQENPYRWRIALVSLVATGSIFSIMFGESQRIEPRAPEITWISTLDETRTDEEIMASNIANQKEKDRIRAEREQLEAEKREIYEAIGRASGMDVEEARAKGEAERAAKAKAEEEARQRALAEIEARQN
ncbi:hypothetical protein [Croceicoccus pelagius]|uniref:Uncharacterized protein n=1 Tax=Croceicoccus pelagius TaxID=1703341 RepID=A0A916YME1_9SPHN|nr:hypothetical protein [Croceicoccus pelagius]GGD50788.1 hypothetical protein GCM10010989_26240 [Croceicoccus pelagius]